MTARRNRSGHGELKQLQRRVKEELKLSALEQARLEVDSHEKLLEVLLSVHKEGSEPRDWNSLAYPLRPPRPERHAHHELCAKRHAVLAETGLSTETVEHSAQRVETAQREDEADYRKASFQYELQEAESDLKKQLAIRVLARDVGAYAEALDQADPLAEIADLCVSAQYIVHTASLVECELRVQGTEIIPAESKTLTSTGKVSTRAMPKGRVHEIYQDYVCGATIRVARETLDLLPIEKVLVTAFVDAVPDGDRAPEQPVLSVLIPRSVLDTIDCDTVDPSDAMEHFLHRGDVRASRKTGEFTRIEPLTPLDVPEQATASSLAHVLAQVRSLREALKRERDALSAAAGKFTAT